MGYCGTPTFFQSRQEASGGFGREPGFLGDTKGLIKPAGFNRATSWPARMWASGGVCNSVSAARQADKRSAALLFGYLAQSIVFWASPVVCSGSAWVWVVESGSFVLERCMGPQNDPTRVHCMGLGASMFKREGDESAYRKEEITWPEPSLGLLKLKEKRVLSP